MSKNEEDCPNVPVVVPASLRSEVLKVCHNVKTSELLGTDKTLFSYVTGQSVVCDVMPSL